ncbi:MAG: heavy-metal-associated domain-containing protein [Nitrososphaerota archaeon]|nr:heavy-metal-associated domain-containing protein [Nitrososphaerota archaeon]
MSSFVILKLCDTSNNAAIEAGLRTLKGIISTKINYVGGTITISFDPDNVSIEEIESRVRQTEKKRNWLEEIEIRLGELEEKRAMTIARGARI